MMQTSLGRRWHPLALTLYLTPFGELLPKRRQDWILISLLTLISAPAYTFTPPSLPTTSQLVSFEQYELAEPLEKLKNQLKQNISSQEGKVSLVLDPQTQGTALLIEMHSAPYARLVPQASQMALKPILQPQTSQVLIGYDAKRQGFLVHLDPEHFPKQSTPAPLFIHALAAHFVGENFRPLLLDSPQLVLAIKYLRVTQASLATPLILRQSWQDSLTGELMVDSEGRLHTQLRPQDYPLYTPDLHAEPSLPLLEPRYYLEQALSWDKPEQVYRYYPQPQGILCVQAQTGAREETPVTFITWAQLMQVLEPAQNYDLGQRPEG